MLLPIFTKSTLIFTKSILIFTKTILIFTKTVMIEYFKSVLVYRKMKQKFAIFRINDYFCLH